MTRPLPPRPSLQQLKHQAKDLLRSHEKKDASVCNVLRRLRRFASAGNEEILAQTVALHDAQFALAMEYGFSSWTAMKRYVEKATGRPDPIWREKNRTYITGLEGFGIGCKDAHDNSMIACIAGVMQALGEEELTYDYLMGVSGAAFRVQMHQPNWCPSAACAVPGYSCFPGAIAATGYRLVRIDTQRDGKWLNDGVEKALQAVHSSIERGIPVLQDGKEASLAVGYRSDNGVIIRPYESGEDGYKDIEVFDSDGQPQWVFGTGSWDDWVWGVGIFQPQDTPPDPRETFVNSLRLAVKLAKTEWFGQYLSGFAALEHWANKLLDDSYFNSLTQDNWFGIAHGNGYCYPCLWSARFNAEKYLRTIAEDFENPIRKQLLVIADMYQKMHLTLSQTKPEFDCIWSLQPWTLKSPENWTREIRQKESTLLKEVLKIERQTVEKIETVLPLLEIR